MIFDGNNGDALIASNGIEAFTCGQALLRRVSQHRYLEIKVTDGATITDQ